MAALVGPSCHFSSSNANGSDTVGDNVFQTEAQTCGLCTPDTQRLRFSEQRWMSQYKMALIGFAVVKFVFSLLPEPLWNM